MNGATRCWFGWVNKVWGRETLDAGLNGLTRCWFESVNKVWDTRRCFDIATSARVMSSLATRVRMCRCTLSVEPWDAAKCRGVAFVSVRLSTLSHTEGRGRDGVGSSEGKGWCWLK